MKIDVLTPHHLSALEKMLHADNPGKRNAVSGFELNANSLTRQFWQDPDYEPELIVGAFDQTRLLGFCAGVRRPWKPGRERTGFIKWVYVEPVRRREGIGTQLLAACESALRTGGAVKLVYGSSAPRYIWPGVYKEDSATQALLNANGWRGSSERINLQLPLPCFKTDTQINSGEFTVSPVRFEDRDDAAQFLKSEFSTSWWRECEPIFERYHPAFGFAVRPEGVLIGFVAVHATNPSWLGPMGVRKDFRGHGIGRALLYAAVRESFVRESHRLTIPWVNESFYHACLGTLERQVFIKYKKD